jgi:hypothetical protein
VRTSAEKTKPATGYKWAKFCGDDGINGTNGNHCYIKYNNTTDDDTVATDVWTASQPYIGFALSDEPTAPETGYDWVRVIPDIKQATGTSTADIMSQSAVTNAIEGIRSGIDMAAADVSASSGTHYHFGRTVSGTIGGTARAILTQCEGTLYINGNSAVITVVNSPGLNVLNKTVDNFYNVIIDGKSTFEDNGRASGNGYVLPIKPGSSIVFAKFWTANANNPRTLLFVVNAKTSSYGASSVEVLSDMQVANGTYGDIQSVYLSAQSRASDCGVTMVTSTYGGQPYNSIVEIGRI